MKKLLLISLLAFGTFFLLNGQPTSWNFAVTYNSHIILIEANASLTINGNQLSTGDYVGVFYVNSTGQMTCGGYTEWTGAMTHLTAWPEDLGNDGFPPGSEFIWKIWDASNNEEYIAIPEYDSSSTFTSSNIFQVNGTGHLLSLSAITNTVPWNYQNSGSNHIVLLPSDFNATIDGNPIQIGDYIGAFYSDNGMAACGGYIQWLGVTTQVTVWADDTQTTNKDGFDDNELISWKIWDASENVEHLGNPTYMGPPMTNQGNFQINGLSGLQELTVTTVHPGWSFSITPINHTILLPFNSSYLLNDTSISSGDYIGVFYDSAGVEACAGYAVWEGITTYVSAFGDDNLSAAKEGFFENELLQWKIWDASADTSYSVTPDYDQNFPSTGNFTVNGQSSLLSLINENFQLPWTYNISCCNHTILLPSNGTFTFDSLLLPNGFYLGVFYDSMGTLACAGYAKWEGSTTSITVWGDDANTPAKEGFYDGDQFTWKAWSPIDGSEYYPSVSYLQPPVMPNTAYYTTNGLSGLASLHITSPIVPWSFTNTGDNHSVLVSSSVEILIDGNPIEAGDYIGAFYDSLGILVCAGYTLYDGSTTAVTVWGADVGYDGMATGEAFKWKIWDASESATYLAYASYDQTFPNQELYTSNGMSSLLSLTNIPPFQVHPIELTQGWGIYSTYIAPFDFAMDSIFLDIKINIDLVKNGNGQVYWPDYGVNLIGDLTQEDAYLIKMKITDTLEVIGLAVDPLLAEFTINQGWNMIAYLRSSEAPIELMFASISNYIEIAKDGQGNIFWPMFSINFIGNLKPGKGYLIKLTQTELFHYPAN